MSTKETTAGRANLSPVKRALLEKRLAGGLTGIASNHAIPRVSKPGQPAPLSFTQEQALRAAVEEGRPSFYNIVITFIGLLDIAALEQSFEAIIARHETLRTSFCDVNGRACQIVRPATRYNLEVVDLSELPSEAREARAAHLAVAEGSVPLNLALGSLFRLKLLRMNETEHRLLCVIAHIACDHWSLDLLTRELTTLYEAFSHHRPSPLAELPIQYADFARWQRARLGDDSMNTLLDYWKRQLYGAPPALQLPLSRPRPTGPTFLGGHESLFMPEHISASLETLEKRTGNTQFIVLLAAFNVLLHHYTGRRDILVGSATAGRNQVEVENLIGCFVNLLVIRTRLSGEISFRELLSLVRTTALEAFAHEEMPFGRLVEEWQTRGDPVPPVQINFTLHNATKESARINGLGISSYMIDTGRSAVDLTLSIHRVPRGLLASFEYKSDLFERNVVKNMLKDFQTLLTNIVANPDQTLSALSSAIV